MASQFSEQELQGLAETYQGMMQNPETRGELLRLIKKRFPERNIPEVDATEAIDKKVGEQLKARDEKISELEKKILETDLRRQIDERRSSLRRPPFNFSDEDITEIEKIVTDNGVTYDFAAQFLQNKRLALKPSGFGGNAPLRSPSETDWRKDIKAKDSQIRKDFEAWQGDKFDQAYKEAFGS
jgi:hypothetical protein